MALNSILSVDSLFPLTTPTPRPLSHFSWFVSQKTGSESEKEGISSERRGDREDDDLPEMGGGAGDRVGASHVSILSPLHVPVDQRSSLALPVGKAMMMEWRQDTR